MPQKVYMHPGAGAVMPAHVLHSPCTDCVMHIQKSAPRGSTVSARSWSCPVGHHLPEDTTMSDIITIRGFVATDVTTSTTTTGVGTASFRLGSPSRHFDKTSGTWVEDYMNWFTVQGYRQLAGNMGCSIKKGQRVIVVGRLKLASWER